MYLHLGRDTVVHDSEIIGIFDLEKVSQDPVTRSFLKKAQKNNRIITITDELPASFVVCKNGDVYLSQISASTLKKRADEKGYTQSD